MKKLNYIDTTTNEHVTVDCTLPSEEKLQEFYRSIERIKWEEYFNKNERVAKENLISVFRNIIEEENTVIDTAQLFSCIKKGYDPKNKQEIVSSTDAMISAQFFDLFGYSNEVRIPSDQYELYAYSCRSYGTFGANTLKELTSEKERYQNNGSFFSAIQYIPGEKVKVKEKIIPFEVNKRRGIAQEA